MDIRIGDHFRYKDDTSPFSKNVVVTNIYKTESPRYSKIQIPPKMEKYASRAKITNDKYVPKHDTIEFMEIYGGNKKRHDIDREQFENNYVTGGKMSDPHDPHWKNVINGAFQLLVDGTYSSGGDGSGTLLVSTMDWRMVADMFGEFEVPIYSQDKNEDGTNKITMEKIKDRYYRHDYPDRTSFSDMSNEGMMIGPAFIKDDMGPFDDVTIIL